MMRPPPPPKPPQKRFLPPDPPPPIYSPDLSQFDREMALWCYGSDAELIRRVRAIGFDWIGASSLYALELETNRELIAQGVDPFDIKQVINKAREEYANQTTTEATEKDATSAA